MPGPINNVIKYPLEIINKILEDICKKSKIHEHISNSNVSENL